MKLINKKRIKFIFRVFVINNFFKIYCLVSKILLQNPIGKYLIQSPFLIERKDFIFNNFKLPRYKIFVASKYEQDESKLNNEEKNLLAKDLIKSLKLSLEDGLSENNFNESILWKMNCERNFKEIKKFVFSNDHISLAKYLDQMFQKDCLEGISASTKIIGMEGKTDLTLNFYTVQSIYFLSEYLGIIPSKSLAISSQLPNHRIDVSHTVEFLLEEIEKIIPIKISQKIHSGVSGLKINRRIISPDLIEHLYTAIRVKELLNNNSIVNASKKFDSKSYSLLEIGAGFGDLCSFSNQILTKQLAYFIIDLPFVNLIQGWFLSNTLGRDKILLYSDLVDNFSNFKLEKNSCLDKVILIPSSKQKDLRLPELDLIINQDSFAEMDTNTVRSYLKEYLGSTNPGAKLYSVNQESQTWASQVIGEFNLSRIQRSKSWIMPEYIEEIYKI